MAVVAAPGLWGGHGQQTGEPLRLAAGFAPQRLRHRDRLGRSRSIQPRPGSREPSGSPELLDRLSAAGQAAQPASRSGGGGRRAEPRRWALGALGRSLLPFQSKFWTLARARPAGTGPGPALVDSVVLPVCSPQRLGRRRRAQSALLVPCRKASASAGPGARCLPSSAS